MSNVSILVLLASTGAQVAKLEGEVNRDTAIDFLDDVLDAVDGQAVTVTISGLPSCASLAAERQAARSEAFLNSVLPAFRATAKELGLGFPVPDAPAAAPDVEIQDPPTEEAGADFEEVGPPAAVATGTAGKRRGA